MDEISAQLLEKAKAAGSAEELAALAKENGVELTAEEAGRYFVRLNPPAGELPDEELDNVAGGGCGGSSKACPHCGAKLRAIAEGNGNFSMKYYWLCDGCGYKVKQ